MDDKILTHLIEIKEAQAKTLERVDTCVKNQDQLSKDLKKHIESDNTEFMGIKSDMAVQKDRSSRMSWLSTIISAVSLALSSFFYWLLKGN